MAEFYILDGINGVGKTTIAKNLAEKLGYEYARLPGWTGNNVCVKIRDILESDSKDMTKETRFHLYAADMFEFFSKAQGRYVLDRSFISTLVYQSMDGIDQKTLVTTLQPLFEFPTKTIYLKCDPSVAMVRINNRSHQTVAAYQNKDTMWLRELQRKYDYMMDSYAKNLTIIDTSLKTLEDTQDEVMEVMA